MERSSSSMHRRPFYREKGRRSRNCSIAFAKNLNDRVVKLLTAWHTSNRRGSFKFWINKPSFRVLLVWFFFWSRPTEPEYENRLITSGGLWCNPSSIGPAKWHTNDACIQFRTQQPLVERVNIRLYSSPKRNQYESRMRESSTFALGCFRNAMWSM